MNLLNKFIIDKNIPEDKLVVAGIMPVTISIYDRMPLGNYDINIFRSLKMITGLSYQELIKSFESIEASYDTLNGFRFLLEKYNCSFPDLEYNLYSLLQTSKSMNIDVPPFTFNSFNASDHENIKVDLEQALINTITTLSEVIQKILTGEFEEGNDNDNTSNR